MSLAPARSYTRLAIAIVIAAIVISASILSYSSFEATVTRTTTVTTTSTVTTSYDTTCLEPVSNAASVSASDCQLGITLGLATEPGLTFAYVGYNETFRLSLTNDLAMSRNVNYTGFPTLPHGLDLSSGAAFDYVLPLQPACGFPSISGYEPAFVVIYNSTGSPMQLSDSPLALTNCVTGGQNYHPFSVSQTITEALSVGGYWTGTDASEPWINATYSQFSPGDYTVVAFDPWGQLVELNFSVIRYDTTTTTVSTSSSTGTSTAANGAPFSNSSSTTDSSQGLRLGVHVSVNATGDLSIQTNESNLLNRSNNVTTANDWPYPNTRSLPCGDFDQFPIEYAVLQGYYDTSNYTSARALALYDTGAVYPCPTMSAPIPYFLFAPLSDNASVYFPSDQRNDYVLSANYSVTGYWTGSGTSTSFHQFPPGVYTLLVEDEWGDVVLLHFTEG